MNDSNSYSLDNIILCGDYPDVSGVSIYFPQIIKYHLDNNTVLRQISASGSYKYDSLEKISNFMKENKAIEKINIKSGKYSELTFMRNNSLFSLTLKNNVLSMSVFSNHEDEYNLFHQLKDEFIVKDNKDCVFSITNEDGCLSIKNVGIVKLPLIEENYHENVISDYKYVCEVFNSPSPSGRICILNGPPGTGKSSLIKSALSDINGIFVIIPSNMIDVLDKPDFLPTLIDTKNTYNKPIILIVEDGDSALVPRKSNNMSLISSILNLSDGIVGSIVDIRIFITTNSNIKDIDEAVSRPGRLCKNISIDPLEYEFANKVYKRLTDESKNLEKNDFYTLAEVYAIANDVKIASKPEKVKKANKIGFTNKME